MADKTKKVILVTDGDKVARKTVTVAAKKIGARCISASWGNPTPVTGPQMVKMIEEAPRDPIVVMLDDRGHPGQGAGEQVLEYIYRHPDIDIIGVLAVASNTPGVEGISIKKSVSRFGEIIDGPVDKAGIPEGGNHHYLEGDTVDILNRLNIENIVGIGDIGKMDGADDYRSGARITTKALEELLENALKKDGEPIV